MAVPDVHPCSLHAEPTANRSAAPPASPATCSICWGNAEWFSLAEARGLCHGDKPGRQVGALLMRLPDVRRGSPPLNLGHGEPWKVCELWSYTGGQEEGEAHTSSPKDVSAGASCPPLLSAPLRGHLPASCSTHTHAHARARTCTRTHAHGRSSPLERVQTRAALRASLLCITWAAPLC